MWVSIEEVGPWEIITWLTEINWLIWSTWDKTALEIPEVPRTYVNSKIEFGKTIVIDKDNLQQSNRLDLLWDLGYKTFSFESS